MLPIKLNELEKTLTNAYPESKHTFQLVPSKGLQITVFFKPEKKIELEKIEKCLNELTKTFSGFSGERSVSFKIKKQSDDDEKYEVLMIMFLELKATAHIEF